MFGFLRTIVPTVLLTFSAGGLLLPLSCKKAEAAGKPKSVQPRSPLAGGWISDDSDAQTAFRLVITQRQDSVIADYCLVAASGQHCNCYRSGAPPAFAVAIPADPSLESDVYDYQTGASAGRVRLSLEGEKLYWRMVEATSGQPFMVKQTTFSRDTSFHEDKK